MIRKTIIVVLTLGAITAGILHLATRSMKVPPLRRIVSLTRSHHLELVVREGFLEITYKDEVSGRLVAPTVPSRPQTVPNVTGTTNVTSKDQAAAQPPVRSVITSRRIVRNVTNKEQIIGFDQWYEGKNWRCARCRIALWLPCILLGTYPVMVLFRGPLLRHRRRRRGACIKCGYDLTGNATGVCPECGTKVEPR